MTKATQKRILSGFSVLFAIVIISAAPSEGEVTGLGGAMPTAENSSTSGGDSSTGLGRYASLHPGWQQRADRSYRVLKASSAESGWRRRGAKEADLYSKVAPSVVLVEVEVGPGEAGLGSGFIVDSKPQKKENSKKRAMGSLRPGRLETVTIVTNFHVIEGAQKVWVSYRPESKYSGELSTQRYPAQVGKFDQVADLAVLTITQEVSTRAVLEISTENSVRVGDDVHAIGHPGGEDWTYTRGIVSQIRSDYEWLSDHVADVIQTQTPIFPGNSGGPLMNDSGAVVGINTFGHPEWQAMNYAVTAKEILRFLASSKNRCVGGKKQCAHSERVVEDSICEWRIIREDRSDDSPALNQLMDANCDGEGDFFVTIPDNPSDPIIFWFDRNSDGNSDFALYDADRDGCPETSLLDQDYDGKGDLRGYHENCSLEPDRYELIQ